MAPARNTVGQTTGMDIVQLGIFNPFSRHQESEADYLGIIFANLAGVADEKEFLQPLLVGKIF